LTISQKEGHMGKALEGVRILDMTHVQSGPTCTQILAWFGADVIKIERPGEGDPTRSQLRDIPGVDSLYFTMLNSNKRSITLNPKTPAGNKIFTKLIEKCDVMVENYAPGAIDRMGFPWDKIQQINPRMVYASVKGFGPGPYEDCKVYENVAQCTGGSASTTGEIDRVPLVTGSQIGDSGTGIHLVAGILAALLHREKSGRGQRVSVAMQDAVLNLCRVKLRDQQRLAHGPLKEYPQFNTPEARLPKLDFVFSEIEKWTMTMTKMEVMATLNPLNVPCGPVLSMKELSEEKSLRATGTVVEVEHPKRGMYLTVGNPIKLSDSPAEVR